MFETKNYIVEKIDGDYAHLRLIDKNESILVAMALLPLEIEEGSRLEYKNLEYTIK